MICLGRTGGLDWHKPRLQTQGCGLGLDVSKAWLLISFAIRAYADQRPIPKGLDLRQLIGLHLSIGVEIVGQMGDLHQVFPFDGHSLFTGTLSIGFPSASLGTSPARMFT